MFHNTIAAEVVTSTAAVAVFSVRSNLLAEQFAAQIFIVYSYSIFEGPRALNFNLPIWNVRNPFKVPGCDISLQKNMEFASLYILSQNTTLIGETFYKQWQVHCFAAKLHRPAVKHIVMFLRKIVFQANIIQHFPKF